MATAPPRRRRRGRIGRPPTVTSRVSSPPPVLFASSYPLYVLVCLYSTLARSHPTAVEVAERRFRSHFDSPTSYHHRRHATTTPSRHRPLDRSRTRGEHERTQSRALQFEQVCSCAPRSFTITLDLLNDCFDDTVASNPGIRETDCTIQLGDDDVDSDIEDMLEGLMDDDDEEAGGTEGDGNVVINFEDPASFEEPVANGPKKPTGRPTVEEILATVPWLRKDAKPDAEASLGERPGRRPNGKRNRDGGGGGGEGGRGRANRKGNDDGRRTQSEPTAPVLIASVTFIEINSLGNVINVDDSLTNVQLTDGSSFALQSISASLSPDLLLEDQLEFVPSTAVLFLVGSNSLGGEILARFVWRYTNGCGPGDVAIEEGDELAWNAWTEVEDQFDVFCPANGGGPAAPTDFPINSEGPTTSPSDGPTGATEVPTPSPTLEPTTETIVPTSSPTDGGESAAPTDFPINSEGPTSGPTDFPGGTEVPTPSPSDGPTSGTEDPTAGPTLKPTPTIIPFPTFAPSFFPSPIGGSTPSPTPMGFTPFPTPTGSAGPTFAPTPGGSGTGGPDTSPPTTPSPSSTEPTSTEPTSTEPTSTEPTSTEPTSSTRRPTERTMEPSSRPYFMSLPLLLQNDYGGDFLDYFGGGDGGRGRNGGGGGGGVGEKSRNGSGGSSGSKSGNGRRGGKSGKRTKRSKGEKTTTTTSARRGSESASRRGGGGPAHHYGYGYLGTISSSSGSGSRGSRSSKGGKGGRKSKSSGSSSSSSGRSSRSSSSSSSSSSSGGSSKSSKWDKRR